MLTLYWAKGTCALASHIALEQACADYKAERLDFSKTQQRSPEYLRINPKGRVPALVTDQGILTETPAILLYVAQLFPKANLAPLADPYALAQVNAFNSYLCSTVHVAHAHKNRGSRWADDPKALEAMKKKVPQTVGDCFELIEKEMFGGPWVMGERYSICDPYLFTLAKWLESDDVDINRFPKVADHHRRMAEIPAAAKVLKVHAAES
ncbi:MAG: glutathione S-transferase family protein [Burkholderiales bacterium]